LSWQTDQQANRTGQFAIALHQVLLSFLNHWNNFSWGKAAGWSNIQFKAWPRGDVLRLKIRSSIKWEKYKPNWIGEKNWICYRRVCDHALWSGFENP
jgi:hypothetical protein